MRRRIREAIVGVSAIILLVLGIPLAIVVHRSALDSEVVELQATAATALTEIEVPLHPEHLAQIAAEPDAPERFGVYDSDGNKVFGRGPATADAVVDKALAGKTASSADGEIVVATPITERGTERVAGVLRITESMSGADSRSRAAWLIMGAAGLAALGLAWVIGNRLARLLADPLTDLAASAATIGEGSQIEARPPSGIDEIDELAGVLADRARKVHEALQRERQFSADVSHQLRTPITALRLKLESGADERSGQTGTTSALADLDRLEQTIEHLLAVAREQVPTGTEISLNDAVRDAADRWAGRAQASGRTVTAASPSGPAVVLAQRASIDEILNVLIENSLRHGSGPVSVSVRHLAGGVAVDVADEGASIELLDAERIFARGHTTGDGEGIGLAVARSIAEAEGGRLVLTRHRPTTFSLLLIEQADEPTRP